MQNISRKLQLRTLSVWNLLEFCLGITHYENKAAGKLVLL